MEKKYEVEDAPLRSEHDVEDSRWRVDRSGDHRRDHLRVHRGAETADDGSIVAWGANFDGQTDVPAPNSDFVAIAAGAGHNLGGVEKQRAAVRPRRPKQ